MCFSQSSIVQYRFTFLYFLSPWGSVVLLISINWMAFPHIYGFSGLMEFAESCLGTDDWGYYYIRWALPGPGVADPVRPALRIGFVGRSQGWWFCLQSFTRQPWIQQTSPPPLIFYHNQELREKPEVTPKYMAPGQRGMGEEGKMWKTEGGIKGWGRGREDIN